MARDIRFGTFELYTLQLPGKRRERVGRCFHPDHFPPVIRKHSAPDRMIITQALPVHARRFSFMRGLGLFWMLLALWLTATFSAWWFDDLLAWSAGLMYIAYDTWLIGYVAWNTRMLRYRQQPVVSENRLSVGVIVPARNEVAALPRTLDALLAQTLVPQMILVVDDGSTDSTLARLTEHYGLKQDAEGFYRSSLTPALCVLSKPHGGKAEAMNAGWPVLNTDLVVTVDADTQLASDALAQLCGAFAREPELAAACGVLLPTCSEGRQRELFQWFQRFEYVRTFLARAAWMRADALLLVSGAFACYRRVVLQQIGGFDRNSLVEDYELIHRLHRHAYDHDLVWRVRVIGEARAQTDAPGALLPFLRQRRRWFAGFLQTQFAYRAMHGSKRYGRVGLLMLPVKAADTLQPLFGITAFILLLSLIFSNADPTLTVLGIILVKLAIDLVFHLWAVHLYFRWLGRPPPKSVWSSAVLATLLEPFSFQLVRHCSALWGWLLFMRGRNDWVPQRRGI